ncbi:MAG: plsC [Modestobacter sp.]|nr:plsC [Modestobacter sp.]
MPTVPVCASPPGPTVDGALRRRRWLRLAGVLAGTAAASLRAPVTGARGRRRLHVCAAARVLTAVGVRVQVVPSPVGWPRTGAGHGPGHLVVANSISWVDDLALRTVVPGPPVASSSATVVHVAGLLRAGQSVTVRSEEAGLLPAATAAGAAVCPVAVRYRVDGGAGNAFAASLAGEPLWRSLARVVATRGLVVDVHLLPALDPAVADRRAARKVPVLSA